MIQPFFSVHKLALLSILYPGIAGFVPSFHLAKSCNFLVGTRKGIGFKNKTPPPLTTSSTLIVVSSRNNEEEEEANLSEARRKLEDLMARSQNLSTSQTNSTNKFNSSISPPLSSSPTEERQRNQNRTPLFGEIPVDGSILVVAPAAVIAIVGIFMSMIVILKSGDVDVMDAASDVNVSVSASTVTVTVPVIVPVVQNECRGLCSNNQEEQLEKMSNFMNGLTTTKSKKHTNAEDVEMKVEVSVVSAKEDVANNVAKDVQVLLSE